MRPFIKRSQDESGYVLQSSSQCTTVCCPASNERPLSFSSKPFKKDKKFIHLTITKPKQPQFLNLASSDPLFKATSLSSFQNSEELFKQDKSDFLQQIRKYTPEAQFQKQHDRQKQLKQLDSTKQFDITPKTNQNSNLSTLLQNISSEYFSDMFVSSSIKGKIMMSGSLGSISEVKSEMEISNPTETIINNLQLTQQR